MKRTDEELLRAHASGDAGALGELVVRHRPEALRLARRVLRDAEAAEDAVQEAFIALAESASRFEAGRELGPWFRTLVLNGVRTSARALGRRRRHEEKHARERSREVVPPQGERRVLASEVGAHLARLPLEMRTTLVLHFFEGRSLDEVAAIARCPKATARIRLRRGLERLRASFEAAGRRATFSEIEEAMGVKGDLTKAEVRRFETKLRDHPADRDAREALVEHFFFAGDEAKLAAHLDALVEHHPGSDAIRHFALAMGPGAEGKALERKLARKATRTKDPDVLVNLATHELFMGLRGDDEPLEEGHARRAEKHFQDALGLDPASFEARLFFGALLEKQGRFQEALEAHLALAERVEGEEAECMRGQAFADGARLARKLGDREKARLLAERALGEASKAKGEARDFAANAAHTAHTTLGQLALEKNDIDAAIAHARSSLDTRTSAQLGSFGPGTKLIDAIAAKGRVKEAIELLELCRRHTDDEKYRKRIRELGGKPRRIWRKKQR